MTETQAPVSMTTSRRVLIDTDVVLDVLPDRAEWAEGAARLLAAVAERRLVGVLAGNAVTTVCAMYQEGRTCEAALRSIEEVLVLFEVAPVGRAKLTGAVASEFRDYEDSVVHEAACASRCDAIVTRNGSDFQKSTLPVYTPAETLAVLAAL